MPVYMSTFHIHRGIVYNVRCTRGHAHRLKHLHTQRSIHFLTYVYNSCKEAPSKTSAPNVHLVIGIN